MTTQLLDGPGGRWSVSILNLWSIWSRVDAPRHTHLGPQQLQFRERLTQEIMTHTRLRPWAMAGMLNENAALRRAGGKAGRHAGSGASRADAYGR